MLSIRSALHEERVGLLNYIAEERNAILVLIIRLLLYKRGEHTIDR